MAIFAPPKLADFILTERLGSGTYATVYKAYRKGNSREVVAVKVVAKKTLNKASTENLLTEIEILKTVRHPHIVQLKDFQWDADNIYLILEWCSGGDLSRFIRSRRILPESVARRFLQQIACALQFLHERNISHLDLKPQNILLSGCVLKLADFGFAQYMSPWDEKSVLRGSPLYMAPEMVCRRQYDSRADLWSVGVILYEALFGRAPFASKSFAELEEKIRSDQPVELPPGAKVSKDCRDLLLRLLERNPDARITFAEFFTHPFVDMEHMPSADSMEKAKELVLQAVQKDQEGERSSALSLYCSALEHFVPAIHYETDRQRKEALRQKVCFYSQLDYFFYQLIFCFFTSPELSWARTFSWTAYTLHGEHLKCTAAVITHCNGFPQVKQYVSRAEELKALLASDNKRSFEEARSARDVLRGKEREGLLTLIYFNVCFFMPVYCVFLLVRLLFYYFLVISFFFGAFIHLKTKTLVFFLSQKLPRTQLRAQGVDLTSKILQ
uniref:Serine/threonine-protein kinase ULK3 n=1 Tax=Oryzias sinensis TaxID=183150 RepID=A0A8C7ZVN7_9TELE